MSAEQSEAGHTWKARLYGLNEADLDAVIWRYLTFPKFINLLSYGALWFSKLSHLEQLEGTIPLKTDALMRRENEKFKHLFPDENTRELVDVINDRDVEDGRELTAVSCWFLGDLDSELMWRRYVRHGDGVAIKSTIRSVRDSVPLYRDWSSIGKVEYIDHKTYEMSRYDAGQAHRRAFLKDAEKFSDECELRIETMNVRTPFTVDPSGRRLSPEEVAGFLANNTNEFGLFFAAKLRSLFDTVVVAPGSDEWFFNLVKHLVANSGFDWEVRKSWLHWDWK